MEDEINILGILVENNDAIQDINAILHEYGSYVIGRLGIPYHKKELNVITVVIESTKNIANEIKEKITKLDGIKCNILNLK